MVINFGDPTHYTAINYPAGEQEVRLTELAQQLLKGDYKPVIQGRIKSSDLVELLLLVNAIKFAHSRSGSDSTVSMHVPYLPYGRNDRVFVPGGSFGSLAFNTALHLGGIARIHTLDSHSLKNAGHPVVINQIPFQWFESCVADFAGGEAVTVLFPDKGARERYSRIQAEHVQYCDKIRNHSDGTFVGFEVPDPKRMFRNVVIVDDLCDGGGTFLGIAEELRSAGFAGRLGLVVTHGIFSKGLGSLLSNFEKVYTTDSFQLLAHSGLAGLVVADAFKLLGEVS